MNKRQLLGSSYATAMFAFVAAIDVATNVLSNRLDEYFKAERIASWASAAIFLLLGLTTLLLWRHARLQGFREEFGLCIEAKNLKPEHVGFVRVAPGISGLHLPSPHLRPFVEGVYVQRSAVLYEERHRSEPSASYDERQLQSMLEDGISFLLIGRPTEGKTRTLFEIVRRMPDHLIVTPGIRPTSDAALEVLRDRNVVCLFDDINQATGKGVDLVDFHVRVSKAARRSAIAASCRNGIELAELRREMARSPLQRLFDGIPFVLSLVHATDSEKDLLVAKLGMDDGRVFSSLGSISMKEAFETMYRRFTQIEPTSREVLWSIQLLAGVGIEPILQRHILVVVGKVFDRPMGLSDLRDALEVLESNGFVRSPPSFEIVAPVDAYALGPEVSRYYREGVRTVQDDVNSLRDALLDANEARAVNRMAQARWDATDVKAATDLWIAVADRFSGSESNTLRIEAAQALLDLGLMAIRLYVPVAAMKWFSTVVERFDGDTSTTLRGPVATALFELGLTFMNNGRSDAAIPYFDQVIGRYYSSSDPDLREQAARSLMNRGVAYGRLESHNLAIRDFDRMIVDFREDAASPIREHVARARSNRCEAVAHTRGAQAAINACDEVFESCRASDLAAIREQAARALLMKAEYLKRASSPHPKEENLTQQLACYQLVVDTFSDDESPHLRHRVASALLAKAIGYCEHNEKEAALRAIDDLVAKYSQDFLPATRAVVATAWNDKGQLLERLDLSRAMECYDAVISNYRHHPDASLRFVVAKAMGRRATLAMQQGQGDQGIDLLNQIVTSYENDSSEELKALVGVARELLTTINPRAMPGDSAS